MTLLFHKLPKQDLSKALQRDPVVAPPENALKKGFDLPYFVLRVEGVKSPGCINALVARAKRLTSGLLKTMPVPAGLAE